MTNRLFRAATFALLGLMPLIGQAEEKTVQTTAVSTLAQELQHTGVERFISPDYKPGVVRHIVLFRYKENVTRDQRAEITRRFLAMQKSSLRKTLPFIVSIETGQQHSGEGADQNLEQAFVVTFRSQGDRNYYVGQPLVSDAQYYEPVHQRFKEFVGPMLASGGVIVFDYTVEQRVE